jgi:hypothetical protein
MVTDHGGHHMDTWSQPAHRQDAGATSIARTRSADLVDFLFLGVSLVPLVLAYTGNFDLALLAFCAMLIAGCLGAAYFDSPARPEMSRNDTRHEEEREEV